MIQIRFLVLLLILTGCKDKDAPIREPVYLTAGAPMAGVAEVNIDFPIGAPMGGYSNRCNYLGRNGAFDKRRSPYTQAWSSSAGIQTRSRAQALWMTNGDQDFVLLKADVIYSYDNLVREIEQQLSEKTGRDLEGRVVLATSHTHNAPANYSDSYHFYLGGDRYNEEVFRRFSDSLVSAALEAWDTMEPAAIGMGIEDHWDPDDNVYSDRRGENDTLKVWDDAEPGKKKDPRLWILRIDDLDGDPMGVFFNFGMHGTMLGADNAMVSTEASGHVEYALAERFDSPVVVAHLQGSGGDAAPRGRDEGYARLESVGEFAADAIHDLWEATPTNSQPIVMETVTQSIPEGLEEVRVSRNGAVDWYYPPFSEDREVDNIIYKEDGTIDTPLDEFNAQYGGAFCGYDDPVVPTGSLGIEVYPYDGCMQVELVSWVIAGVFGLPPDSIPLPLPSSTAAMTSAAHIGPMDIRQPDGTITTDSAYFGFFPGEVTQMFTEQFNRRASSELGLENVFTVGYAQDHEGYLLIPEDWLVGGYEPNINIWGPLQGEHIMEGGLDMFRSHLLTTRLEPQDALGEFPDTEYPERELPILTPDTTAEAGTAVETITEEMWSPLLVDIQAQPDPTLNRVQGVAQFAWYGGDPSVDLPTVVLEILNEGTWTPATTNAGREVTDTLPDIITAHTPDPLYPWDAPQTHIWWAGWQAVPHGGVRTALPLGTYRLHVYGKLYTGTGDTWPWETTEYELTSDPFEVIPALIHIELTETEVWASIDAPAHGFRLVDMEGSSVGHNPVHDAGLTWIFEDGTTQEDEAPGQVVELRTRYTTTPPEGAVALEIADLDGNIGMVELE